VTVQLSADAWLLHA